MDLADAQTLKGLLTKHGLAGALKSLGQHFLISRPVVDKIIDASAPYAGFLEIGPGPGVLTSRLAEMGPVVALELDERMVAVLADSSPTVKVLRQDALKADLGAILQELPSPRAVVSNLPYYITGPLLRRITEARAGFDGAVLMMQKEVGDKIVACPGDRGRGGLSICLQRAFQIRKIADVPPGAFLPPPKVESIVLSFTPRPESFADSPAFDDFVHAGFRMPRKTLLNNLAALGGRPMAETWLSAAEIDGGLRPQFLTEDQWLRLFQAQRQKSSA